VVRTRWEGAIWHSNMATNPSLPPISRRPIIMLIIMLILGIAIGLLVGFVVLVVALAKIGGSFLS